MKVLSRRLEAPYGSWEQLKVETTTSFHVNCFQTTEALRRQSSALNRQIGLSRLLAYVKLVLSKNRAEAAGEDGEHI
jgi:hypothetical protein